MLIRFQMTDYVNHLFSYVAPDRLETFSYGHVIPPENLTAQSLGKGVLGSEFSFTYNARDSEKMVGFTGLPLYFLGSLQVMAGKERIFI